MIGILMTFALVALWWLHVVEEQQTLLLGRIGTFFSFFSLASYIYLWTFPGLWLSFDLIRSTAVPYFFMLCQLPCFSCVACATVVLFYGAFRWRKCLSQTAHYNQAKHFLRSHNLISLRSTVSPHFWSNIFSGLCIWAKIRWSHWFYFPSKGNRLFVLYCSFVSLKDWNQWDLKL